MLIVTIIVNGDSDSLRLRADNDCDMLDEEAAAVAVTIDDDRDDERGSDLLPLANIVMGDPALAANEWAAVEFWLADTLLATEDDDVDE